MELNQTLSTDEKQELLEILTFKNNLLAYIGMDNFIDEIRNIINDSKSFEFRSANAEKFIKATKPIFILKLKDLSLIPTGNKLSDDDINKFRTTAMNLIGDEIVSKSNGLFDK